MHLLGLTLPEFAVLNAAGHALGDHGGALGDQGCVGVFCRRHDVNNHDSKHHDNKHGSKLDNSFFVSLLSGDWRPVGGGHYVSEGATVSGTDLLWTTDKLQPIAERWGLCRVWSAAWPGTP